MDKIEGLSLNLEKQNIDKLKELGYNRKSVY